MTWSKEKLSLWMRIEVTKIEIKGAKALADRSRNFQTLYQIRVKIIIFFIHTW